MGRAYNRCMDPGASNDIRYSAKRYFALVDEGILSPDDRVELLEGVIVASPPSAPPHAQGVRRVERILSQVLGQDIVLSSQLPFHAGTWSVPEPDVAVLPGRFEDYETSHPTSASLVVEVSLSSLAQDRLTKSRIYAAAGVKDYWIVNLRDGVVEWFAEPDMLARLYRSRGIAGRDDMLSLAAFPSVRIRAAELLPPG
jgi:Uma2 family endonuclease